MATKEEQGINRLILSSDGKNEKLAYHLLISQGCTKKEAGEYIRRTKTEKYIHTLAELIEAVIPIYRVEVYDETFGTLRVSRKRVSIETRRGLNVDFVVELEQPVDELAKKILRALTSEIVDQKMKNATSPPT